MTDSVDGAHRAPVRRRGPGVSAGISLRQIIKAARGMDPEVPTMQAIADALGVNRKAISHYVADRDSLLELVAADAFAQAFSRTSISLDGSWQQATREFAVGLRDSLILTGALAPWVKFNSSVDLGVLAPSNDLLQKLYDAGFDVSRSGLFLTALVNLTTSFARDVIVTTREGRHQQTTDVGAVLDSFPEAMPALRRLHEAGGSVADQSRFEFDLDVLMAGFAALSGSTRHS